jgi:hypothetical protein
MQVHSLLEPILCDDVLTRGLGDAEARVLIEWLVEHAEELAQSSEAEDAEKTLGRLLRRARAISRFVRLWCIDQDHGAAVQLAATERFTWPWPDTKLEAWDLMKDIVDWETAQMDELRSWDLARKANPPSPKGR